MKIYFEKNFQENIRNLLRNCGYSVQFDSRTGETSYIKRIGRNSYPHFHIYVEDRKNKLIFNLHLDQKKPSYLDYRAHSAEYDGNIVEREARRITAILDKIKGN